MKYDGASWCKQTAATEEHHHCIRSLVRLRPRTKRPLMKILIDAWGTRGEGLVDKSRANHTPPSHTIPKLLTHPSPPYWAYVARIFTMDMIILLYLRTKQLASATKTNAKLHSLSTPFPSSPSTICLACLQSQFCMDLNRALVWSCRKHRRQAKKRGRRHIRGCQLK